MVNPTGLIQDIWHETVEPQRRIRQDIIRELMGPHVKDLDIRFYELNIINQCNMFVTMKRSDLEHMLGQPLSPEVIQRLASHIADFSLAGLKAASPPKS